MSVGVRVGFRTSACTHGDTFCHLNFRIKRYARFFLLPSSQTEQEMSKLKINPIKNYYSLPLRYAQDVLGLCEC